MNINKTDINYLRQNIEELIPLLYQENELAKIRNKQAKTLYKITKYLLITTILNLITIIIGIIL